MDTKKTTWMYRVIRWLVWLFSPRYRIVGAENLPEGACVIAGNHSQMYGPIAAELYTPGEHYTWCIGEMMNKDEIPDYAYRDFWSGKPRSVRWFYRLLSYCIVPLSLCLFRNANTIPVYHDVRLRTTFRESVEQLRAGRRLVIFPEHYAEHNNIVHDFQDRFIDLARLYYQQTGQELRFVPLYLAPRLKLMCYGKPIRFHAEAPAALERRRICEGLMDAITDMAASLPEHTVVPYPNIAKKDYPKNVPVHSTTQEKTSG